ncbi:MAG TPA: glucose-6-phosphate dehydrogenase assembly protein OpcA [Terrimesophilobacter sp.]|nr:glucose-6-phosphate dehydrogenase assembly protein OpcA [Terrimesophilobacter sp.]HRP99341.1 glucose-6-phosphate dehydrogenase assembly protein OpcA [Terrimesophilobacter sp.]
MIVQLPGTTVSKISRALVDIREEGGAVALGRVLTLVICTGTGEVEEAITAANDASREHPMRVIVLATNPGGSTHRLDAEIRVGGDAGASEVILLRAYGDTASNQESLVTGLLLPDAPVVAWWPGVAPDNASQSPIGAMAQRRITDAAVQADPRAYLFQLAKTYEPGDTDFAWTRLTLWRAQLAAVLDQPPYDSVTAASVTGASDSPSTTLLAAWLRGALRVPVNQTLMEPPGNRPGIHRVALTRPSGDIVLERIQPSVAALTQPGQPEHDIPLPRRSLRDCLTEELRRLDPDDVFGTVVRDDLARLSEPVTASISIVTGDNSEGGHP